MGILAIIMVIGIFALATELMQIEEAAKIMVIPSLILLIGISGYAMLQTYKNNKLG
jgi:hypothetical protein